MLLGSIVSKKEEILNRITIKKINQYRYTLQNISTNIEQDKVYQKNYNGFYRVRFYNKEYYRLHYSYLQSIKQNKSITYAEIIKELSEMTGRLEVSFSSKILATIDPNAAPLDKYVLKNLGLKIPYFNAENRMDKCIILYHDVNSKIKLMVNDSRFNELKLSFQKRFPEFNFTDIKIMDLYLWQYRQ